MYEPINEGAIVDLGNVIIAHWLTNTSPENFHTINYNAIPEVPNAMESLRIICDKFSGNITVAYNATNVAEQKIQAWLMTHSFFERTGISPDRVIRSTTGRDKTQYINQETLTNRGTTIVVDDRLEVLNFFVEKVKNLFLFHPQQSEVEEFNHTETLSHVIVVHDWINVISSI
ncbi:hypothetical protein H0X32_00625 [Patescibacteria group bacterium]|nr:hypothetical protein [Patescibacteria group bacterium]